MKKAGLKIFGVLFGIIFGLILAEIGSRIYFSSRNFVAIGKFKKLGMTRKITATVEKNQDVTRIAFLGDSYTYGYGVEEENTFPSLIESRMNRSGNKKIESLNFGQRGANVQKELRKLKRWVIRYSPDIIVHGFVMNDFTHPEQQKKNYKFYADDKIRHKPFLKLEKYSRLLYYIDQAIFKIAGKTAEAQIEHLNDLYDPLKNSQFQLMSRSLEELIRIISSYKGIVAFFPHFIKNEQEYDFYRKSKEMVSSLCKKYGVDFIELYPLLDHKPYFKWWIHPEDHHPNKEAHSIIADALIKRINARI